MILTSALRCLPLAEVAPVARCHHQSPPTISPLLSACLDSAIDHATNSTWFISTHLGSSLLNISTRPGQSQLNISTQHFNSTWRRNDQPPGSMVYSRKNVAQLNGMARLTSSKVQLADSTHTTNHNTQTTHHTPHTTNHNTHTPHITHHTPQAISHKQPTSSFPPVAITHMTAERRGQIPTGGVSGSGTSPGSRGRETDCDVRGGATAHKTRA